MPTKTKSSTATKKKPAAKKKASSSNQCWPGYEHVPGKKPGEKGSCKPKKGS